MVETDPRVAELIGEIDQIVLPGPRKRVTDDVTAWGKREGRNLTANRLLEAYNEAVGVSIEQARSALERHASHPSTKPALLTLLSDPRATDLHRQIALDALAGHLDRTDLSEFGRVNARQRPGVVPKARQVLRDVDLPEARFLLRRVIPGFEDDAPGSSKVRLDAQRTADTEDSRTDLLFDALVLSEPQMADLAEADGQLKHALSVAADERDAALIAAGRTTAGLNDYESGLRRELHVLTLVAALATSDETRSRARNSLFGLDLARFEHDVAPSLPGTELVIYVSRALSPDNRRNRPDRSVTALYAVGLLPPAERPDVREHVVGALSDRDDDVRFAAAVALARDFDPTSEERSRLVEAAASLPDELREKLQPLLGAVGSEVRSMSFRQVIDWAEGAPGDEAERRVRLLLEEWEKRAANTGIEDAEGAMAAISRKVAPPLPNLLLGQLVDATTAWLRERRGTAAATRALIDGWKQFAELAIVSFGEYSEALNAKAARRLLAEALRPSGPLRADLLALAAGVELEDGRTETILMPVLRQALVRAPDVLQDAVDAAADEALINLLVAAVLVTGELGRSLDELSSIGSAQSTEALRRTRARVLEALEVAERDSVKNDELRAQLALVRDALGLDSGTASVEPTEAVAKWRAGVIERYRGVAIGPGPEGALIPVEAPVAELVELMLELDPRVNGRGVVPARDRPHYARDLSNAIAAYAALDEPARHPLSRRASSKLREEIERATSSDPGAAVRRLEESLSSSDVNHAARAVAVVSRVADARDVRGALQDLSRSGIRAAAPAVARALIGEHAKLERAREAQGSREARAAGEIARRLSVPFQAIETRLFSYFRLRAVLEEAGWRRVAPHLGAELPREQIDPERFAVQEGAPGHEVDDAEFLVRSLGIEIAGQIIDPAVVEPVVGSTAEGRGGRRMIGLDFGTTNSCAAFADSYLGEVLTASVAPLNTPPYDAVLASSVLDPLAEDARVGVQAEEVHRALSPSDRASTPFLSNFKPDLNVARLRKQIRVVDETYRYYDGLQQIDVERHTYRDAWVGKGFPREQLVGAVALLLDRLLAGAIDAGGSTDRILLGTPVAFSSRARKRMVAALYATGRFAGYREIIETTRFIPEPVAAAAMGMREAVDPRDRECVMVFDHGGGTLDLSIIEFERRTGFDFLVPVRELAPPSGENGVAGRAFDEALKTELCASGRVRRELESLGETLALRLVRDVKERLSTQEEARLAILEGEGEDIVTRAQLEIAAAPLLGQIEQQIRRLLAQAAKVPDEVDRVLMTGGSSLIPCVQEKVRGMFPALAETGRVRAYDPADPGDVERAITEIAQGLALLGGDESDFRRAVIWDVELLDSEGRGFRPVADRGDTYELDDDGRPLLKRTVPIEDANRDGMALGVWESRLDKRTFMFGIAEVPPSDEELLLEVVLRPDALYPTLRILGANGGPLERESEFGWPENRMVAADIGALSEGQLADFFDQDEVDYLPTAPFGSFRHAPLTRFVGLGDVVEWVEHRSDGRPPLSRAGEVVAIRQIGSHEPLDEIPDFVLTDYELRVRVESSGGQIAISPQFGTIRIRPIG